MQIQLRNSTVFTRGIHARICVPGFSYLFSLSKACSHIGAFTNEIALSRLLKISDDPF